MMSKHVVILYGSQYGSTRRYAEWIVQDLSAGAVDITAEAIAIDAVSPESVTAADAIIIGASDYGGSLTGADRLTDLASALRNTPRVFFTVSFSGLDGATQEKLDGVVAKNFGELAEGCPAYHYRGALDHTQLSFKHKAAMVGIRTAIKAIPQKNTANRQMLESFEKQSVDYSDRQAIAPLVTEVKRLIAK